MWLTCGDCGEFFREEECDFRQSVLEDGFLPWDGVDLCPYCRSDNLHEIDTCILCKGPIKDEASSEFCEDCREWIDEEMGEMFDRMEAHFGVDRGKMISMAFARAEEVGFYE